MLLPHVARQSIIYSPKKAGEPFNSHWPLIFIFKRACPSLVPVDCRKYHPGQFLCTRGVQEDNLSTWRAGRSVCDPCTSSQKGALYCRETLYFARSAGGHRAVLHLTCLCRHRFLSASDQVAFLYTFMTIIIESMLSLPASLVI